MKNYLKEFFEIFDKICLVLGLTILFLYVLYKLNLSYAIYGLYGLTTLFLLFLYFLSISTLFHARKYFKNQNKKFEDDKNKMKKISNDD